MTKRSTKICSWEVILVFPKLIWRSVGFPLSALRNTTAYYRVFLNIVIMWMCCYFWWSQINWSALHYPTKWILISSPRGTRGSGPKMYKSNAIKEYRMWVNHHQLQVGEWSLKSLLCPWVVWLWWMGLWWSMTITAEQTEVCSLNLFRLYQGGKNMNDVVIGEAEYRER